MNRERLQKILVLCSALCAGFSLLIILVAIAGPNIGLGELEEFVFYQMAGIGRRSSIKLGATGLFFSVIPVIIYFKFRFAGQMAQVGDGAVNAVGLGRLEFKFIRAFGGASVSAQNIWSVGNRDWVAVVLLLPAAVYVFVFSVFVLPDVPWIASDSTTYITFATYRTPFYPLFLRFLALFSDNPMVLIIVPIIFGLGTVLFFAEMLQRLTRNILVSVPVGLTLLFNWPLIDHSVLLLTDYPFFVFLTLTFALVLLNFRQPTRIALVSLGLAASISIAVRPLGLLTILVVPFLLILHRHYWRRILAFFATPFVIMWLGFSVFNLATYDFFGMSRFSGYPLGNNMIMLLKPDTPTAYPELRSRLLAFAGKYQREFRETEDLQERFNFLLNATNPLIHGGAGIIRQFGNEKKIVTLNEVSRHKRFYEFINSLSPLNMALGQWPVQSNPKWVWLDKTMAQLARDAHLNNLSLLAEMTFVKLRFSWQSVLLQFNAPVDFRGYRGLDLSDPNYGHRQPIEKKAEDFFGIFNIASFNQISSWIYSPRLFVSVPLIVLFSSVLSVAAVLFHVARRKTPSPVLAAVAFFGISLVAYHLVVSVAQIPLSRFLMVMNAASATLFFISIALIPFINRLLDPRTKQDPAGSVT